MWKFLKRPYGHFEGGLGWLPMGVYAYPFLEQKCHYCDFHSVVVSDQDRLSVTGSYLVSLHKEARYWIAWGGEALPSLWEGTLTKNFQQRNLQI